MRGEIFNFSVSLVDDFETDLSRGLIDVSVDIQDLKAAGGNMTDIQVYDEGTEIRITVNENNTPLDLSAALVKDVLFRHKSGLSFRREADFLTDGTDGKLVYILKEGDIVLTGKWMIQVYLEFSTGKWHTSKAFFDAYPNIVVEEEA